MYLDNLNKAQIFYEQHGFNIHDVPWVIERRYINVTLPKNRKPMQIGEDMCLIGSAEQSFIKFMEEAEIENYLIQAVTPCFRQEDVLSETIRPWFMKLELCHINPVNVDKALENVIEVAMNFYSELSLPVSLVETDEGYDIYYEDLELGSYGLRKYNKNSWIYGTGCTEPRCSIAIQRHSLCV